MNPAIKHRLDQLVARQQELSVLLSDSEVVKDQHQYRVLSQEYAETRPQVELYEQYQSLCERIESAKVMTKDEDAEIREMAREELTQAENDMVSMERDLQLLMLPRDKNDERNVILEIRAGTGGQEAALFAADLFRMYGHYAERQRWEVEVLSRNESELGGYKEIILRIVGRGVYSRMKFESGGHRVQRVPVTEASGRIHTSACTIAVMPEAEEVGEIDINPADLKVDTFRASGAGGQHVNKTDSAIRITHLPTGLVIECQDERSQHKNRARAMTVLRTRLLEAERRKQKEQEAATRKSLVGSGDRSERIRTYNFPQGRVTDHRIGLTLYKLERVLEGEMDELIDPLTIADQEEQLAALGD